LEQALVRELGQVLERARGQVLALVLVLERARAQVLERELEQVLGRAQERARVLEQVLGRAQEPEPGQALGSVHPAAIMQPLGICAIDRGRWILRRTMQVFRHSRSKRSSTPIKSMRTAAMHSLNGQPRTGILPYDSGRCPTIRNSPNGCSR